MRVDLFGVGTKSDAPAITAQRRINCMVEVRRENDRTHFVLQRRPGLTPLLSSLGANTTRGLWPVNTLATPLLFAVQGNTLKSVNNALVDASIGTIGTAAQDVSLVDDGTNLMLVDGSKGYYYNMVTPAGLNAISSGNFTSSPKYVTWQDTYFIATSGLTNQFQLSSNSDPSTWPAVNIGFTGAAPGALQAGLANHGVLNLFGQMYAEFWQDTGSPDFPYAFIPGSSQEFGLASAWSLAKFDNALAGIFQSPMGGVIAARTMGFSLRRISTHDIEQIMSSYTTVSDARGFAVMINGHPLYVVNFPSADACWAYDASSQAWSEWQAPDGTRFWGEKYATFQNRHVISDRRNGNLYQLSTTTYDDNGSAMPMEVVSKHIWNDDKYLTIDSVQVDFEQGTGTATGQGSNPVVDLQVSKDGGHTFTSIGFASVGKVGEYTTRTLWRSLGAARDWVLKLRITDPVAVFITGASAEIKGGAF